MKKTNLFLVSFVIGFISVLVLGISSTASAQTRADVPDGFTDPCLGAFNDAYDGDGAISAAEATAITQACVDMDVTQAGFFETLADRLNGPEPRPTFNHIGDVIGHFSRCIRATVCPNEGTTLPPRATPRLVLEGRGPHHMEGRGWHQQVVCEDGTVPFNVEERYAHVDGESRRIIPRGTTLVIVYCLDPNNSAAPGVAERGGDVDLSRIIAWLERHDSHLTRIDNACAEEGGMRGDPDWDLLCLRLDQVVINSTNIRTLTQNLQTLSDDVDALRAREDNRWAADCGRSDAEWTAMSEDDRLELIRSGQCDGASTTVVNQSDWHLRFHLGVGLHLVGLTAPAGITSPNAVVYGELEALPSEHFGFYLRGMIGAGDLLDRIGQYNPEGTIGFEGIAGGSAGLTIRFNEMFALDAGLASSFGFNPGGQIGRSLHTWPWFQIGGELRLHRPRPCTLRGASPQRRFLHRCRQRGLPRRSRHRLLVLNCFGGPLSTSVD
ncbi:hypothetical protein K8R04_04840 [Candidatus Uhrbacteria bacterium]|nr:hypothetical protein [Candidatus Uhrbacteria bacterium]